MIINRDDRISAVQAAIIVINVILGVGVLTLPQTATENIKTPDAWVAVILGGLIALLAGLIAVKLCQRFRNLTFYEFSRNLLGKWIGSLFGLIVVVYFTVSIGFQVRALAEVAGLFLLEGTPAAVIIMSIMWVSVYLITGGISAIARLFQIIFPITVIIFCTIIVMGLSLFEPDNLRPVLGLGFGHVLKGIQATSFSFAGFESILFITAFMSRPEQAVKSVAAGIGIPMVLYVLTVVVVVGAMSAEGVVIRTWPTIDLIRSYEFPGVFFERYESLLLVVWIMQIFATRSFGHYAAALGLAQLFHRNIRPFIFGVLPVSFIIAMIPKNINDLFALGDIIGNTGFVLFGIMPLVMLIIAIMKGERRYETD